MCAGRGAAGSPRRKHQLKEGGAEAPPSGTELIAMRYFLRASSRAIKSFFIRAGALAGQFGAALRSRTVAACIIGVLVLAIYSGYITQVNSFFVVDDGVATVYNTYTSDALLALQEAGIALSPSDHVAAPAHPVVGGYAEITITRGLTATVRMDGRETTISTNSAATVRALLDRAGYEPQPHDIVEPPLDTAAQDGMRIVVTRQNIVTEQVAEAIPYTVIRNDNRNLNEGTEVVTRDGVPGEKIYSYEVTYRDGVEISRRLVLEAVTVDPIPQIIECGTAKTITTASGEVYRYSRRLDCSATAYTTEGRKNKINAIGNVARVGTIAVDPKVIPLRSKVYVTSANGTWDYGVALCEDTGGSIKGNIVDLFFNTVAECYSFGRRKCVVYVLEE